MEDNGLKYPEFAIFNQRGSVIKIAQWQPLGEILFDSKKVFVQKIMNMKKRQWHLLKV